jgi:hypothetical protein
MLLLDFDFDYRPGVSFDEMSFLFMIFGSFLKWSTLL